MPPRVTKLCNSIEWLSHLAPRRRSTISFVPLLLSRSYGENPKTAFSYPLESLEEDPNKHPNRPGFLRGFSNNDTLGFIDWQLLVLGRTLEASSPDRVHDVDSNSISRVESKIDNIKRTKQGVTFTWLNYFSNSLEIKDVTFIKRIRDAAKNLSKSLENSEEDCAELGKAYRDLAEAFVAVSDFKEALPHCWEALDMHENQWWQYFVEVVRDRKLLGIVYSGLQEHEKALEQNVLAQTILKNCNLSSDLLLQVKIGIDAANMMIALGRHDEAVSTLKNIIQQTDEDSETRALVLISMAKALCYQEMFADCKSCLEISLGILRKRERISPVEVVKAYTKMSTQYEIMNEFEISFSLLKRALALLERHCPQEQHSQGRVSARIGWLLLLSGKVQSALFYLEGAVERLNFAVGYAYNNLGVAYQELDRPRLAAEMFGLAKEIIESESDSIEALQNLAKAQSEMANYDVAVDSQEDVMKALNKMWEERIGTRAEIDDKLSKAGHLLCLFNEKMLGESCNVNELSIMKKALVLPQAPAASRISLQTCHLQNP